MYRSLIVLIWVGCLSVSNSLAVSVHYGGIGSSMPFELVHRDVEPPLEIVLQLANESDAVSVLSWQLDLQLRALSGSQGELLFEGVAAAPDPLFGETSAPQSNPALPPPTDAVFVQDIDTEFAGQPLPQDSARNIVQLTLSASSNATGEFQLVMPVIENPETDSSWLDANDFLPKAFENTAPSAFPGFILLGTIHVSQPGDYDSDGEVTAADYDRWVATFADAADPVGSGADGNANGTIDAADYVIWRRSENASAANSKLVVAITPEPAALVLVCLGLTVAGLVRRSPRMPADIARVR